MLSGLIVMINVSANRPVRPAGVAVLSLNQRDHFELRNLDRLLTALVDDAGAVHATLGPGSGHLRRFRKTRLADLD